MVRLLLLVLFFAGVARVQAVDYVSSLPCFTESDAASEKEFDEVIWPRVTNNEVGLGTAFEKTGEILGKNKAWRQRCIIERSEESKTSNPVYRHIRFETTWTQTQTVLGRPVTTEGQNGFDVEYTIDRNTGVRDVTSFDVCRNLDGCGDMGFKTPTKPAKIVFDTGTKCTDTLFNDIWPALMLAEALKPPSSGSTALRSSLYEASLKSIKNAGTPIPTACTVAMDAAVDLSDLGSRPVTQRLSFYQVWEKHNKLDVFDIPEVKADGVRVDYRARCKNLSSGSGKADCGAIEIKSFAVCRTVESCNRLGMNVDARQASRNKQMK